MFTPNREEVLAIIRAGIQAPSADNQHHIRFSLDQQGMSMDADDAFMTCNERHRRLLMLLSFGAVAENIRLTLTAKGWTFEPSWFPDGSAARRLLRIEWSQLESIDRPDPLMDSIDSRHTNRRFFKGPKLPRENLAMLEAAATKIAHVGLEWLDDIGRRRDALRLIRIAETARFGNRALHEEMFESIDFAAGWRRATTVHLAPATLEVEPFLRIPFGAMRHWSFMRTLKLVGAHHVLGLRAGDIPARTSPHIGVLTSTDTPDHAALSIGAAFQRLWLAADAAGLALQPMVASAILAIRNEGSDPRRDALAAVLHDGWRAMLGETLPLVVFRLGNARRPSFVSARMPAESYLQDP